MKSAGPSPRSVSRASSTSSALPDGAAERLLHVGQEARHLAPGPDADLPHLLGEHTCVVERLHERSVADLDVEHDRLGARGELLRHDRARNEGDDVDGCRDVAERVELLVGRNQVGGLSDDRDPDLAQLRDELLRRQLDAEAGDRLELVEGAAGVPEPAAAHLPERDAAGGDDRPDGERGLVPHSSGRMLVDDLASERCAEVERLAGADHRVGQRVRLRGREAVEVHGHAPGGELVVGHLVARVREDQLGELVGVVLFPVPLLLDQLGRPHRTPLGV